MFEFTDNELGKIVVAPHRMAKHVIARRKNGYIQLTVPYGLSRKGVLSAFQSLKPKLADIRPLSRAAITENDVISSFSFQARIVRHSFVENISLSLKNGQLLIFVPDGWDISLPEHQHVVRKAIVGVLRIEAKRILSGKVAYFAQKHALTYNSVKINTSKTRWGSCSWQKNINFSAFLLLLPEKYIDYIVLHELAHTVEMNHSDKFWALLDTLCGGGAKLLGKEVKRYKPFGYDFLVQE